VDHEMESQLDLLDEDDAEEVRAGGETMAERVARVRDRLGVTAPVAPVGREYVRFELMNIPGGELVKRSAAGMAASFELVALMHPPSVKPLMSGRYTVLAGRRRCLALMRDGVEGTECNVYAPDLTDAQAALITLVENHARGAAWVRDVQAIAELLHVARLTIDELAPIFGRARSGIAELARIAKLPDPLLEHIYAGRIVQADARAITRLRPAEIDRLAGLAASGGEVTPEEIRATLRGQWSDGMSRPLAQVLDMPAGEPAEEDEAPAPPGEDDGADTFRVADWGRPAMVDMLSTLEGYADMPARVRALAKALRAELERLQ
jgi:ParB/RepB/Spo0J family partition protein